MNFKSIFFKVKSLWTLLSLKEKFTYLFLIAFLLLVICLYFYSNQASKALASQKNRYSEYMSLAEQYQLLYTNISNFEKKQGLTKSRGLLDFAQSQFEELGIKNRIKSLKGLGTKDIKDYYIEESIDIVAENMTMNEIANILFRLERAPMMISIKNLNIKKSFENPDRLNIQITISQFTKK